MLRFLPAIALTIASIGAASAADNCTLQQAASIDLTLDQAGGANIPISIGDKKLNMLVDTGGLYSMLTEETVDSLGLKRASVSGRYRFTMFGGTRISHFATAHSVALGNLVVPELGFLVMPSGHLASGVNGTIAPDLLHNYDVEFNLAGGKLNFFSPDHCDGKVVYWTHDPYAKQAITLTESRQINLPVTLDGSPFRATLDTGASRSIITVEAAREHFGWGNKIPNLVPIPNGDAPAVYFRYPFSTLTFEGITVKHPDILLVTEAHRGFDSHVPDMLIGMSVLRQLRTYIAYREHNIYFTAAEAH